jgi:hypothetical protein
MPNVFVLTGMPGAGKEEFVKVALNDGYSVIRMGDVVRMEAERRRIVMDDRGVGGFASSERQAHGPGIWAERCLPLKGKGNVVIDGSRSLSEIEVFRSRLGKDVKVVAIHTSPERRFARSFRGPLHDRDSVTDLGHHPDATRREFLGREGVGESLLCREQGRVSADRRGDRGQQHAESQSSHSLHVRKGSKVVSINKKATEEVAEEPEEDPVMAKVKEATEGMSNEEIASFLTSVGIRASGKREALLAKVAQAVSEGKITLDDDAEEAEAETETTVEEVAEVAEEDGEADDMNDFENPNMTDERKQAIEEFDKETRAAYKKKSLKKDDMLSFLDAYFNDDEQTEALKALSPAELLDVYIDISVRFIDDVGNLIEDESSAYTLNGEAACCGMHLDYSEESNSFTCPRCGQVFQAE